MQSRISSRIRLAARGLSSAMNSQISVMSCAAPGCSLNPGQWSFRGALLEQLILAVAQVVEESFAVDGLHPAAFDLIVPTVEHVAHFNHFRQVSSHGIFDKIVGWAAALGGQLMEARFRLGLKMDFHECQCKVALRFCQKNWRQGRGEET